MVYKDEKSFAEVIFKGCKFLKEIVAPRRWEVLQYQLSLQCKAFWGIIVGAVTSLAAMQLWCPHFCAVLFMECCISIF